MFAHRMYPERLLALLYPVKHCSEASESVNSAHILVYLLKYSDHVCNFNFLPRSGRSLSWYDI